MLDSKGEEMRLKVLLLALLCYLSSIFGDDRVSIQGDSKWQPQLMKNGFYRSLGVYSGYYFYGEVDTRTNEEVMHMSLFMFGLSGQMGVVARNAYKLEGTLRVNYGYGKYVGGVLDVDNEERNGKPLTARNAVLIGDVELKAGYNLLSNLSYISLYAQSGLGYYLNRNEMTSMYRIQGYLYVPLEFEGEAILNDKIALSYGAGYRYLIFGNHLSREPTGLNGKVDVIQKDGFSWHGFVGMNFFTKAGQLRSLRLVYEYWSIGDSPKSAMSSVYTGDIQYLYEPKNRTHRVFLQYSFGF